MPLSSMTGFARADGAHDIYQWHWEAKSVNGRGLDVRARLPNGFDGIEAKLRERLAKRFKRGNIQVYLQLQRVAGAEEVSVNQKVLAEVLEAMEMLKEKVDAAPPRLDAILALRGVLETVEPEQSDELIEARDKALLDSVDELIGALAAARADEGRALETILTGQIDQIEALTAEAKSLAAATPQAIRDRLTAQIDELVGKRAGVDPDRLAQEIALLATKADIREELDRLEAHVAAARELIARKEPVGRRLDFLTQEFNREANTLCSKSADVELTRIGLELKAVIDQMREQVQNVE